jgi:hypothetical protein
MRHRRLSVLTIALAAAASCTSGDTGSAGSRSGSGSSDSTAGAARLRWFDGTRPLLLAPAHSSDRALVVPADSLSPDLEEGALADSATLVRLDGSVIPARVSLSSGSEGCVDGALQPAPAGSWGVGFVGRAPTPIPVDSMRAISRQDSIALAPIIFRLASTIPNSPGGRFAGLPFSMVDLWRLRAPDGALIIVATTKRQINQEDSPLEERTLLIAEGSSANTLALIHSEQSSGPGETVEGSELLAAVAFGGTMELVFSHDYGDETSYSIVERIGPASWTRRWASRRFSC